MRWRHWLFNLIAAIAAMQGCALVAQEARQPIDDPPIAQAWRALRVVNCERCHGALYTGLAAPSIVEFARTQEREAFVRMVMEGNPPRGMPGYSGNLLVSENIEGIYRYFLGRADQSIGAGDRPARSGP